MTSGMRSISFVLFIFLFLLPLVTAEIAIDDTATLSNYGDKIVVAGQIMENTTLRAYFSIRLHCADTIPISTKIIDLESSVPSSFSQLISIPEGQAGFCTIETALTDEAGNLIDQQSSKQFLVTSELLGSFEQTKENYQLGEKVDIKGIITKYNQVGVDGTAVLKFVKNEEVISRDTVPVKLGVLAFSKDLSLLPPGSYRIEIEAKDNEGNQAVFKNLREFILEGDLLITSTLEKQIYKPGETLVLSGNVRSKAGTLLKDISVIFLIDDSEVKTEKLVTSNDFLKFVFPLSATIRSGSHAYMLKVKDVTGNLGLGGSNFTVQAVPTVLHLSVNSSSFLPRESIYFSSTLLDQAKDFMVETVNVFLLSPQGSVSSQKLSQTNKTDSFSIPEGSLPGTWKLRLEGFGLHDEVFVTIKELRMLDIKLEGIDLFVKNNGNVPFKDTLQVNSENKANGKKVSLGIGDSTKVNLASLFDPGNYTLTTPLTGQVFPNVVIPKAQGILDDVSDLTGNVIGSLGSGSSLYLLLGFLVLVLLLIFVLKPHKHKQVIREDVIVRQNARRKHLHEETYIPPSQEKPKYGIADEKDIEDFRRRMRKMFDEEEQNRRRSSYSGNTSYGNSNSGSAPSSLSTNEPQGNVFDMFK